MYTYNSLRHYNECDRYVYQLEPKPVTRYHDRQSRPQVLKRRPDQLRLLHRYYNNRQTALLT